MRKAFLLALFLALIASNHSIAQGARPNIVFILADDLGYGDVHCLNPEHGKIATPKIDKLAAEGMIFYGCPYQLFSMHTQSIQHTDWALQLAHPFANQGTQGYSEPLIAKDRMTVAELLKKEGYATACFGKWHLGMTMPTTDGQMVNQKTVSNIDWKGTISDAPGNHGFDYFYGIAASLDMPPYIYIENNLFVGEATSEKGFPAGINGAYIKTGAAAKDFEAINVLPDIARKTVEYIQSKKVPFFAYVALTSPHTPILPSPEWQGKSEIGPYGDFVMQTDAVIGQIIDAVDAAGLRENTLIIVSSDNGCSKFADIEAMESLGHYPSANFRGSKSDLWDGGHRVPFIVRWPEVVNSGSQSDQTLCLTDFMATCADILKTKLPETVGEDSESFLPAFYGKAINSERKGVIHHSINGYFAYRQGNWKLLLAKGSGGWSFPQENRVPEGSPEAQLYDMEKDPGEKTNLYTSRPDVVEELLKCLEEDIDHGRSTPGREMNNDVKEIKIWKNEK